jgi:hypothetical protein
MSLSMLSRYENNGLVHQTLHQVEWLRHRVSGMKILVCRLAKLGSSKTRHPITQLVGVNAVPPKKGQSPVYE